MKPKRDVVPLPEEFDMEESKDALANILVNGFGVPPNSKGLKEAQDVLDETVVQYTTSKSKGNHKKDRKYI